MKRTCIVCKAALSGRGRHRCCPGILGDQYLEQAFGRRPLPRTRAALLAVLRTAWLEGFGECDSLRKLGLLAESGFLVDYVLRFRTVAEGGPVKRARLPRRMSV